MNREDIWQQSIYWNKVIQRQRFSICFANDEKKVFSISGKINANIYDFLVAKLFAGGYLATKYLLEQGHTKIGCVFKEIGSGRSRLDGYLRALKEFHIPVKKEYLQAK